MTDRKVPEQEKLQAQIGLRLRAARDRTGLNQEDFAEIANLSSKTISRYESGQSPIKVYDIFVWSTVTDVPVAELLGLVDLLDTGSPASIPVGGMPHSATWPGFAFTAGGHEQLTIDFLVGGQSGRFPLDFGPRGGPEDDSDDRT